MLRKVLIILTFMGLSANLLAQGGDTTKIEYRGYEFVSVYSSVEGFGVTVLDIYKDGRSIFKLDEDLLIESVSFEDLKGNGDSSALILSYTGGAHCCFILYVGDVDNGNFIISDTIFLGDSMFDPRDINGDGKTELVANYVGFAYEFTSFAGSPFPILIYGYKNGKVQMVNEDFRSEVIKDIDEFEKLVKEYPDYQCPEAADEYWGSEAGEVQGYLAGIVFDYASINEADKGYEMVDKYYKCSNKEDFKAKLRNTYNLK
ncbi:MAG: hypothetical protein KDC73_05315 [Ignavibacteriae bacterium]|nr:hypothetical protein [Ignavibacteriota bacterium]MCB9243857.1 hypothetical protein [Ignavibacteriales bacterium]